MGFFRRLLYVRKRERGPECRWIETFQQGVMIRVGWTRARARAKLPRCRLYPTGLRHRRVLSFFLFLAFFISLSRLMLLYFAEMRSNGRPSAKFVAASVKLDERSRAPQLCFFLPNKVLDFDADRKRCFTHPEEKRPSGRSSSRTKQKCINE